MISKKYSNLLFILVMGFGMSLLMTLIITFINTGMDNEYINRFFKAWSVSLPIAIIAALLLGPSIKKLVDKITKYHNLKSGKFFSLYNFNFSSYFGNCR